MAHHHHGAGGCEHSHTHEGDPAVAYSLYQKIDVIHVQCFNESEEGAGKKVFKPWEERLDKSEVIFIWQLRMQPYNRAYLYISNFPGLCY